MQQQPYPDRYYKNQRRGSLRSANEIVPLVLELVSPKSVIDVGCGVGTWASIFIERGIEDVWGVDGSYVNKELLLIPKDRFLAFDLLKPFQLDKKFDLVVSLEVGEHLPSEYAETFVDSLTGLGPVVLFSAAVPFQGGTKHINEQWQDFWARLFEAKGYLPVDGIRKKIWQNSNVVWFYAQNILIYVRRDFLETHPLLKKEHESTHLSQLSIVHPELLTQMSFRSMWSLFPLIMRKTIRRRFKSHAEN